MDIETYWKRNICGHTIHIYNRFRILSISGSPVERRNNQRRSSREKRSRGEVKLDSILMCSESELKKGRKWIKGEEDTPVKCK